MSARLSGEYDDNINTTSTNTQAGFRSVANLVAQANLPLAQTFYRGRYQYQVYYTEEYPSQKLDQTHSFDALVSHTFSPRMVLNLNESFRRGIEPELVDVQAGSQVELRRRGDYLYNNTGADFGFNITRRLSAAVRGGWELWRYDLSIPTNIVTFSTNTSTFVTNRVDIGPAVNDRDLYRGSFEVLYSLTPRTFAGIGYELGVADYAQPGSNDTRNSVGHTGYFAFSHTVNPRLSLTGTAGMEFREFGDGSSDTSPSIAAAVNYTISRDAVASVGFNYEIATTEVNQFRSIDSATAFARASYRFTPKFRANVDALYSFATFRNPNPNAVFPTDSSGAPIIPKDETSYRVGLSLYYNFTRWVSAFSTYSYERVDSDSPDREFKRNRVGLGVDLSY